MTLQKAMRVRADLKKEIVNLNELIHDYPHQISFKGKVPEAEEIAAKRAEKVAALDGMSYEDVLKRMFTLTDAILELNTAIEKAKIEYQKYQIKELIPIEKEYLNSIHKTNKIAEECVKM